MSEEILIPALSTLFILVSMSICFLALMHYDLIEKIKIIEKELKDHEHRM